MSTPVLQHQDWKPVIVRKPRPKAHNPAGSTDKATKQQRNLESDSPVATKAVARVAPKTIMQFRQSSGLTQKQLAARMNLNAAEIQAWEKGEAVPTGRKLSQLRQLLANE